MVLTFDSGDVLEHPQLNNMVRALDGDGVLNGLAVSQRGAGANMSVDVSSGDAWINVTDEGELSTTNLVIEASHATLERKDLITYDSTANIPAVIKGTDHAGTEADPTYPPDIPAGDILLAIVKVDAATTTIVNGDITDCRAMITKVKIHSTRANDTLRTYDDTQDAITTGWVKYKELGPVPDGILNGTLRIAFDMNETSAGTSHGQIRRDGVVVGTDNSTTGSGFTTFSEDIGDWMGGDTIELWAYHTAGAFGNVKNFRVYCDHAYVTPVDTVSWV